MDEAQAVGRVKLDAIYAREKAKEEPSKDEIYSKVFDVMKQKGLVGALSKESMQQKSSKSEEEIKPEVNAAPSTTSATTAPSALTTM